MSDKKKPKKTQSIKEAIYKKKNIGNLNESVNKIPDFKYTSNPPPPKKKEK